VSEWFKTDYSKMKKLARRREVVNGFLCQMYELPSKIPGENPRYLWIAEEVKVGEQQQIPYFFDPIFSPKGLVVKWEVSSKNMETKMILRKITPGPIAPILPRLRSIDFGTLDSVQYKDEKFNQHLGDKKIEDAPHMPDFSFYPVGSNQLDHLHRRLDSGKFVLIDLWGTWCGPCLRELPRLQAFQAEQAALLEVISLNLGDHRADYVQEIMVNHKMSGTQGYAGNLLKAFLNPGQSIPHAILLDPNMKVLWRGNPAGNWEKLAALVRGN
jgi:thiol-disulfide isomerase/thioredoxin